MSVQVLRPSDTGIKPDLWPFEPLMVDPEWQWVWGAFRAYWGMQEGSGTTLRALGRTPLEAPFGQSPAWGASRYGTVVEFRENGYADPANFDPLISDAITVFAFARATASFGGEHLTSRHPGWFLSGDGGSGIRFAVTTGSEVTTGTETLTVGQWYAIAGRYDGSAVTLWIDGVQGSSAAQSGSIDGSGDMTIATYGGDKTGGFRWPGDIAALGISDRALTAAQIRALSRDPFGPLRQQQFRVTSEDEVTGPKTVTRTLSDTFTFTDTLLAQRIAGRILSDVFGFNDNLTSSVSKSGAAARRIITDTFAFSESLTRSGEFTRAALEAFATSDNLDAFLNDTVIGQKILQRIIEHFGQNFAQNMIDPDLVDDFTDGFFS